MSFLLRHFRTDLERFFEEDDLGRNLSYDFHLPKQNVKCLLKIKSDCLLTGLPFFIEAFHYLDPQVNLNDLLQHEGKSYKQGSVIEFTLPFNVALYGERIALNLLQHSSSISTFARNFSEITNPHGIKILDTRKTTPGLRSVEKYAVVAGGCYNHRLGQTDMWMIKDNHKKIFGGVVEAIQFFRDQHSFYNQIEVEIHDLPELQVAIDHGIKHVMLDNFSVSDIQKAVEIKKVGMTYEVSGGVNMNNIHQFLIKGVDAISIGALTNNAPRVDLSMKMEPV